MQPWDVEGAWIKLEASFREFGGVEEGGGGGCKGRGRTGKGGCGTKRHQKLVCEAHGTCVCSLRLRGKSNVKAWLASVHVSPNRSDYISANLAFRYHSARVVGLYALQNGLCNSIVVWGVQDVPAGWSDV